MEVLRTPDDRFTSLPGFPWEPRYAEVPDGDGGQLRMSWVEAGPADGEPVLLLHGEPSWSFLYRSVIPVLADAGLRAVAPDLVGFGRSDKPARQEDHSYARHVGWVRALVLDVLELSGITLVGQDWGGLIGLRLVAEHPDRFARVVVANTGLPTGDTPMSEAFLAWQRFATTAPSFDVGRIVANGTAGGLPPEAVAGYDAPFPDDPAAEANRAAWAALTRFDRPFLTAFSDGDRITGGGDAVFQRVVPGARDLAHPTLRGGGHFLQEDVGAELGRVVADLVAATPRP